MHDAIKHIAHGTANDQRISNINSQRCHPS
ncbi:Uncharacterised protein [Vibrio cholerae]|nr:Uncharacterised protein [Vibrio cholerae]